MSITKWAFEPEQPLSRKVFRRALWGVAVTCAIGTGSALGIVLGVVRYVFGL